MYTQFYWNHRLDIIPCTCKSCHIRLGAGAKQLDINCITNQMNSSDKWNNVMNLHWTHQGRGTFWTAAGSINTLAWVTIKVGQLNIFILFWPFQFDFKLSMHWAVRHLHNTTPIERYKSLKNEQSMNSDCVNYVQWRLTLEQHVWLAYHHRHHNHI